jgi:Flp pilus assembly protein TadD
MSTHLPRGILLYQQDRHALAEQELRLAVAEAPEDPTTHGFLALCLAEQGKLDPAEDEAKLAIRYGPDDPFAHAVLAQVLFQRGRPAQAERAARESLRLDPTNAGTYAVLAAVRHDRRDWRGALEAAEDGLAHDPNHPGCTAARTLALLQLGRAGEAGESAADALRRNPDDPLAHTAHGWAELHAGRPHAALSHFREALRLDPTSDWARHGMIEALKARYWVYRQMLRFFLWMGRLSRQAQWGVILGLIVVQQVLLRVGKANPALEPYTFPLFLAVVGFVVLTWVAGPLFNLLLRLNRFGRFALSAKERRESHWVAGCLGLGLAGAAVAVADPTGYGEAGFVWALSCVLLLLPLTAVFRVPEGWPQALMVGWTVAMAAVAVGAVGSLMLGANTGGVARVGLLDLGRMLFWVVLIAGFLSGFAANGLMMVRQRQ